MEQTHVHDVYSKIASQFNHTRFSHWKCISTFLNSLQPHSIVADIGTGNGKYLTFRNDITVIGNDTCQELLHIIVYKNKHANILQANGLHLPYKSETFDAVISVAVMHHLSTPEARSKFLQEAIRILRPNGGRCIITVWAREQPIKTSWECIPHGQNDYFVPWVENKDTQIIHKRYYHLFTYNELKGMIEAIKTEFQSYNIEYEMGNWCLTVFK
jgi:SAM-dependent methyltransferase